MPSHNQIHIRLNDSEIAALTTYARETGNSIQDAVSSAIRQMINQFNIKNNKNDAEFTFIDLFAGIGGMRIAYENAGGRCVYSNEWNKYSQQTYFANFGECPEGDITKVDARMIPDHDILVAGFPCQPFSIAGVSKKQSLGRPTGFEDKTQGTLFFDVCRILKAKRPKAFMLENVKNLKSHDKGRTFKVIMESLEELNYQVFYAVLDGQNFVPQHRERILIAKHRAAGNGFGYGIADPDGISRTLSARYYKDGSEILITQDGKNPRRLTPRECARLQGFPDTFKIVVSDTQAYKQFGNSVVVPLMENVAKLVTAKMKALDAKKSRKNTYIAVSESAEEKRAVI